MRKEKRFNKLKKILLTVMSVMLLVFSMPIKSEATILADFVDLLLNIPDGIMWIGNRFIAERLSSESREKINIDGVDFGGGDEGYINNFYVTPYDIFTAGQYRYYIDSNSRDMIVYENLPIFYANFFKADNDELNEYEKDLRHMNSENGEVERGVIEEWSVDFDGDTYLDTSGGTNSASVLRPIISNAYRYLRNLAIVLMMVVLLYIGIRIMISSVASEQSKYKQMIVDWLVGLALLFIMHYIMSFILNFNDVIISMLKNDEAGSYYISFPALGFQAQAGNGLNEEWYEMFDDHNDKMFINEHLDIPGNAVEGKWQESFWYTVTGGVLGEERSRV